MLIGIFEHITNDADNRTCCCAGRDLLRGVYEAVAIWAFYEFLVIYLGGRQHMAAILETKARDKHLMPLCCFQGWDPHISFYRYTRWCTIQYIPTQVVMSIVIFVTSLTGDYHDGHFAANDAYIYTAFIVNCSQIIALYGLLEFYQKLKQDLAPTRPFYKFLCIKLVVFFTFWQSVFLSMLVAVNVITPTITYTTNQESYGIDDFVICIEMLGFAIAHWFAFPPKEFQNYTPPDSVREVTQERGGRTGIEMDWMDIQLYKALGDGAHGKVLEVGGGGGAAVDGNGKAAPDWAYARSEAEGGSGAGAEVQMAQLNGTSASQASTMHASNVEAGVQQADSGNSVVAESPAEAVGPPLASVTDVPSRSDHMELTDVS